MMLGIIDIRRQLEKNLTHNSELKEMTQLGLTELVEAVRGTMEHM